MPGATPIIPRDQRLDLVGLVGELQKRFADPLKDKIKASMAEKETTAAAGDAFTGLLLASTQVRSIPAARFLRLYESGKISKADALSALAVKVDPCRQFMSEKQIDGICEFHESTPQLRISRIKGVEIDLINAVSTIAAAIGG